MIPTTQLPAIADELHRAQQLGQQIEPITTRFTDFDADDAYRVSALIHQAKLDGGAAALGRKIGFTNADLWPIYNVDMPIWAHVYDTTISYLSGDQSTFSIGQFSEPKIEPEIIVHFKSTPPVTADEGELLGCIDWIAHGFEIVQSNFPGWSFEAADSIADSGLHAALLIGEQHAIDDLGGDVLAALASFSIRLSCNGVVKDEGGGHKVLGSPLKTITHLLAILAKQHQAEPLHGGELVTTGSLTSAMDIQPGETWSTQLHGIALDGAQVKFTA